MEKNILSSKYPMIDMESAFEIMKSKLNTFQKETISIDTLKSNNYVPAEDIYSNINIPSKLTSMMDGYAINTNFIDINSEVLVKDFIYAGDSEKLKDNFEQNTC